MGYFDDPRFHQAGTTPSDGAAHGYFDDPKYQQSPVSPSQYREKETLNAPKTWAEENIAPLLPDWLGTLAGGNLRGTAPYRAMEGMATAGVGAVQTVANMLPVSTGIPQAVNDRVTDTEQQYQRARAANGSDGFDAMRTAGEVLSPANIMLAAKVPLAASTFGRIGQGAAFGAATGAAEPVTNPDRDGGYWRQKAGQVAGGAATGAVFAPLVGAVAERMIRWLGPVDITKTGQAGAARIDHEINTALSDMGQTVNDIPPAQIAGLREQVTTALQQGKQVDPAALMRQADFEALGMKPTLGQLTRDPMQYTRELDLRGVRNIGEPLSQRFQEQGAQLQARLAGPAAGAQDAYNAGNTISGSLRNLDENVLRPHVSALYAEARASAGKDFEVPLQGLAQDYAQVLSDFGDKVPSAIRSKFAALGLDPSMPSNQKQLFTIENADSLLKVINQHVGNDAPTNRALGMIRDAVKGAVSGADANGGPFAPAVKAAAERFNLQEAVPALKAAAEGTIAPDDFVMRYVINGKTNDVKGLSQTLQQSDPAAWQEARAQIADSLKRAAFGDNVTGDAPFRSSGYMQQIRRLGVDKISAFFNAQEVSDLLRVGRVGAYIKQAPNGAAVNSSNTAGAVANLMTRIPGASPIAAVVNKAVGAVRDSRDVNNALAAIVKESRLPNGPLGQDQQNWLAYIYGGGTLGSSSAPGSMKRENSR